VSGVCLMKIERRLEIKYLLRSARKVVYVVTTFCFVAMVTELSLHLHLLNHEHPEEHDSDHCSVCQQLLITHGKFITEPEPGLPDSNLLHDSTEFHFQSYIISLHSQPFNPRSPPFA
jgi:hypothetical protein